MADEPANGGGVQARLRMLEDDNRQHFAAEAATARALAVILGADGQPGQLTRIAGDVQAASDQVRQVGATAERDHEKMRIDLLSEVSAKIDSAMLRQRVASLELGWKAIAQIILVAAAIAGIVVGVIQVIHHA